MWQRRTGSAVCSSSTSGSGNITRSCNSCWSRRCIDVTSGGYQILDDVDVPGLDGQVKRRDATNAVCHRHLAVDSGSGGQQATHDVHMAVSRCQVNGGHVTAPEPEVAAAVKLSWANDVASGVYQRMNDELVSALAGQQQRRDPSRSGHVEVTARHYQ